jgi:hypothetical protein
MSDRNQSLRPHHYLTRPLWNLHVFAVLAPNPDQTGSRVPERSGAGNGLFAGAGHSFVCRNYWGTPKAVRREGVYPVSGDHFRSYMSG